MEAHDLQAAVRDYGNQEHPGECCRAKVSYWREDGTLAEAVDVPMESPTEELLVTHDSSAVVDGVPTRQ